MFRSNRRRRLAPEYKVVVGAAFAMRAHKDVPGSVVQVVSLWGRGRNRTVQFVGHERMAEYNMVLGDFKRLITGVADPLFAVFVPEVARLYQDPTTGYVARVANVRGIPEHQTVDFEYAIGPTPGTNSLGRSLFCAKFTKAMGSYSL